MFENSLITCGDEDFVEYTQAETVFEEATESFENPAIPDDVISDEENAGDDETGYKEGLKEIPDDWIEVEAPEKLKINSNSFKDFLNNQGKNPKNWRKVVEKWAAPDGEIYQRNYWSNGSQSYYHGQGIEIFVPH